MPDIRFLAMPTEDARHLQNGGVDANGQRPEVHISDGNGNTCRHCLAEIAADEEMLVLSYRPFPRQQPYAETGPIFLHARRCERHPESAATPDLYLTRESLLVRGYTPADRIKYGTGQTVATADLAVACAALLEDADLAYLHVRSATNNCYQFRVERA